MKFLVSLVTFALWSTLALGNETYNIDEETNFFAHPAHRHGLPALMWKNDNADGNSCTGREFRSIEFRLDELFQGILNSRGLDDIDWLGITSRAMEQDADCTQGARKLRGEQHRKLTSNCWHKCGPPGGPVCQCNFPEECGRRRRLTTSDGSDQEEDETVIAIGDEDYEAVMEDVKASMEAQCKSVLLTIALTSSYFSTTCKEALFGATCTVFAHGKIGEFMHAEVQSRIMEAEEYMEALTGFEKFDFVLERLASHELERYELQRLLKSAVADANNEVVGVDHYGENTIQFEYDLQQCIFFDSDDGYLLKIAPCKEYAQKWFYDNGRIKVLFPGMEEFCVTYDTAHPKEYLRMKPCFTESADENDKNKQLWDYYSDDHRFKSRRDGTCFDLCRNCGGIIHANGCIDGTNNDQQFIVGDAFDTLAHM